MFAFGAPRATRRPSLTPMIDVVFLLLVFFMLAARFGDESELALAPAGRAATYNGPPRLVEVGPEGVALNGISLTENRLAAAMAPLMTAPGDAIILRPVEDAPLQRLIDVMQGLRAAGFDTLVVVE